MGSGVEPNSSKLSIGWPLLIGLAAYILSVGMRLIEFSRWDPVLHQVEGEWLLSTHDAYFWVAGAVGANSLAADMPMAVLLRNLAVIIPLPFATLAFWAAILLAALVAIPVALWAMSQRTAYAAFLAAIMTTLTPAYFNRTRLGYYDTDWAALFFPLLNSWLLMVWVRSNSASHAGEGEAAHPRLRAIPWLLILLTAFALPWHNAIGLYMIALLGIAGIMIVLHAPAEQWVASFVFIAALAIVVWLGWLGVPPALLLHWGISKRPLRFTASWKTRTAGALLLLLLLVLAGSRYRTYLSVAVPTYLRLGSDVSPPSESAALVFPDPSESIREIQTPDSLTTLEGIAFHPLLAVIGGIGYLLWVRKRLTALFLFPLLLLGGSSIRLGGRFSIFAAPVIMLGLALALEWGVDRAAERRGIKPFVKPIVMSAILLAVVLWTVQASWRTPIETVVRKEHAQALQALRRIVSDDSILWTWWDYGYATQHFSGLQTFADGGRNTGKHLFSLGAVLGSDHPERSAGMMRFSAQHAEVPWQAWLEWSPSEMVEWLEGPVALEPHADPVSDQYLILQWEGLQALPWIQYYGSWDFKTKRGQHSQVLKVARPLELDLENGIFTFNDDQVLALISVDRLGGPNEQHLDYPNDARSPHLLLNNHTGEVVLLDDSAYHSTLVQLLISPASQPDHFAPFQLIIDESPFIRIFELRPGE